MRTDLQRIQRINVYISTVNDSVCTYTLHLLTCTAYVHDQHCQKVLPSVKLTNCWTATVLEGLFRECHPSSAALDRQRPNATKQPLLYDWSATSNPLMVQNHRFVQKQRKVVL